MKLLRDLNVGNITIQSDDTDLTVVTDLKDFLVNDFHRELIHKLLTNKLNRHDIPIFEANQLQIIFNRRKSSIYFIFFKNNQESKIEIVETSKYYDNVLISLMIEIEQTLGDTLFSFETDFGKIYNGSAIATIINNCLRLENE